MDGEEKHAALIGAVRRSHDRRLGRNRSVMDIGYKLASLFRDLQNSGLAHEKPDAEPDPDPSG